MWRNAWVNGLTSIVSWWGPQIRLTQNRDTGLMLYGTREWHDYRLAADVTPHLARRVGIAVRAQGMRRYYALLLNRDDQSLQLVSRLLIAVPCGATAGCPPRTAARQGWPTGSG